MSQNEQLEFNIGEDESPAEVSINEEQPEQAASDAPQVEQTAAPAAPQEDELDNYSDKVKKRIDKLTARLRETQRREEAALEYAKNVQSQLQNMQQFAYKNADARLAEAKSRVDTQAVALKQIIRKAREEGDMDTEMEAQERLSALVLEQQQIQAAVQQRSTQQTQQVQQPVEQPIQQAAPQQRQPARPDPRAEQWAEENSWFGSDRVMTHAAWGIHADLIEKEGFDPNTEEYYDELDNRIREAFPHKFPGYQKMIRTPRPAQAVAPANRSSGVNNARRTVRLTPSQVAIAKKLGVPLEEYAKYVKE